MIDKPIFVGGAGRSGTTLIRVILDSHPNIACGSELRVTPSLAKLWSAFHEKIDNLNDYNFGEIETNVVFQQLYIALVRRYFSSTNKTRLAEKTPGNCCYFSELGRLFPDAKFVHVIRDGRDVVASLLSQNWVDIKTGNKMDVTRDVEKAANAWKSYVIKGLSARNDDALKGRYHEIRYEDIIGSPKETLQRLFSFLDEPWSDDILSFHKQKRRLHNEASGEQVSQGIYTSSCERWKKDLSPQEQESVISVQSEILQELNYL